MLVEKLSKDELEMIGRYIDTYACDEARRTVSVEELLRYWDDAKSDYLYRMLGNKFIYKTSVNIVKSLDEISDSIEQHCVGWNRPGEQFIQAYWQWVSSHFPWSYADANKLNPNDPDFVGTCLDYLHRNDTLAANVYDGPTFEFKLAGMDKPLRIQKGCKVSKALGQIAKQFSLPGFEEFRIAHSQCLNEKCFKGDLYLSIHPMDFMTMSDNDNDWQSCMNWTDGGEYRRGTVEMMNSAMVVEAYLTSKENYEPCYGVTWNNKKWRELFVVTPQMIAGVKGYPYWNKDLERNVIMILRTLAQDNLGWGPYNCEPISFGCGEEFRVEEFQKEYDVEFFTGAMYNDFYGRDHQCIVTYNSAPHMQINYSGESECLACGAVHTSFNDEGSLVCSSCDGRIECACCGYHGYEDQMIYWNGEYYCEDCYNEHVRECPICGEEHWDEDECRVQLYVKEEEKIYTSFTIYLCPECYDKYKRDGLILTIDPPEDSYYWGKYDVIEINSLTPECWDELGFENAEQFFKDREETNKRQRIYNPYEQTLTVKDGKAVSSNESYYA